MSTAPPTEIPTPVSAPETKRRVPWWAPVAVVAAVIVVGIAAVVGVRGLLADPVRSTAADGTATIEGTFEPYECSGCPVQGYVQAGGRSVFVIFRADCPPPPRGGEITIHGRLDSSQGKRAYRAVDCPTLR
jgi:hypothetical protein